MCESERFFWWAWWVFCCVCVVGFFFNQFSTDLLTTFYDLIWNAGWEGSGKKTDPNKAEKDNEK